MATFDGGGIFVRDGRAIVSNTTIGGDSIAEGNSASGATGRGGGIFVQNVDGESRVDIFRGQINFNTAMLSGGGIFSNVTGTTVRMTNSAEVRGNQALTLNGGGLFNNGAHLQIDNIRLTENLAFNGGGLFLNSGSANILNSLVDSNEAEQTGGGIYNLDFLNILDSIVEGNLASFFPNIFDNG